MVAWRRAIEFSNFFKESHLFGRHLARNGNWTGDSYTALNSASFCSHSLQLKRRIVISVTLRGQTRRFWGGKETLIRASAVAFSNHGCVEVTGLLGPSFFFFYSFRFSYPPTPLHLENNPCCCKSPLKCKKFNLSTCFHHILNHCPGRWQGPGAGEARRGGVEADRRLWLEPHTGWNCLRQPRNQIINSDSRRRGLLAEISMKILIWIDKQSLALLPDLEGLH